MRRSQTIAFIKTGLFILVLSLFAFSALALAFRRPCGAFYLK